MELVIRDARGEQRVRVERREGRYFVRVGEGDSVRHYEVDAVTLGPRLRSLLIEGRQFDVGLAPLAGELPGPAPIDVGAGRVGFRVEAEPGGLRVLVRVEFGVRRRADVIHVLA